jgi:hypothetical protein
MGALARMLRRMARKVKREKLVPSKEGTSRVVRYAAGRAIDSRWWEQTACSFPRSAWECSVTRSVGRVVPTVTVATRGPSAAVSVRRDMYSCPCYLSNRSFFVSW